MTREPENGSADTEHPPELRAPGTPDDESIPLGSLTVTIVPGADSPGSAGETSPVPTIDDVHLLSPPFMARSASGGLAPEPVVPNARWNQRHSISHSQHLAPTPLFPTDMYLYHPAPTNDPLPIAPPPSYLAAPQPQTAPNAPPSPVPATPSAASKLTTRRSTFDSVFRRSSAPPQQANSSSITLSTNSSSTTLPTVVSPICLPAGLMAQTIPIPGAPLPLAQSLQSDYQIMCGAFPEWPVPASSYVLGASAMGIVYGKDMRARQLILNWAEGQQNIRLNCPLSPNIALLTSLSLLQMNNHRLYGSLPTHIGNLLHLKELSLAGNLLSGPIPDSICELRNLEVVDLHDNQLSAPLPRLFCSGLRNLSILRLNNNCITGGIPEDIGNLKNLQQLYLGHNRMDGHLPSSLGNLSKLELLQLQHNRFMGEIPAELGQLKSLKFMFLNSNRLIGELSGALFTGLKSLEYLLMNRNQFNGEVPATLLAIRNIQILRLDNNYLIAPTKDKIPFGLKVGIQLGFKKIVLKPQFPGTPPYQIVPEYSEFPPDVLHPSDHIVAQRNRPGSAARLTTLYDLPDNPNRWNPSEVAFWCKSNGAHVDLCNSILDLSMTGAQFFRLGENDLESALGVWDEGFRCVLFGRMQSVLAVANGLVPPIYEEQEEVEGEESH
ncbi:hypothetical protein HDU98_001452 [Podochytrium sp. JEL0797]|nr:hypothetical protein HDU98_001452 [Podochytrium sp. JEL0797]